MAAGAWALRLAGLALMVSALSLPLMRAPERPVETLVATWAPAPSEFAELEGQLLHWRDQGRAGDPTPLVLLHDAGASLHVWEGWVRALTPRHRVLTLDVPGSGLSGPAPDGDYRPAAQARRVRALLAQAKVRRYVLVGQGAGADVAWATALADPHAVRGLMLINPGRPTHWPTLWRLARLPGWASISTELLPRALIQVQWDELLGPAGSVSATQTDRLFELTRRSGNSAALPPLLAQLGAPQPALPADMPVLLAWGEADEVTPLTAQRRAALSGQLPQARWTVWPGLGHWPQEEDAARTVASLQQWLGEAAGAAGPVALASQTDAGLYQRLSSVSISD